MLSKRGASGLPSECEEKIKNTLAPCIDEMRDHRTLPFFGDQPAQFNATHVLASRGGVQSALVGDFQQGEAGPGADQLKNPDAMLIGKRFGNQGKAGQRVGIVYHLHTGLNLKKRKRMR